VIFLFGFFFSWTRGLIYHFFLEVLLRPDLLAPLVLDFQLRRSWEHRGGCPPSDDRRCPQMEVLLARRGSSGKEELGRLLAVGFFCRSTLLPHLDSP